MPDFIREALDEHGLMDAYHTRPAYQQNDYIGRVTRRKRLKQMLDELKAENCI
jgi:hypothetical protein